MKVKETAGTRTTIKISGSDVTLNDIWCLATIATDVYDSTNCKYDTVSNTEKTDATGTNDYSKTTQF